MSDELWVGESVQIVVLPYWRGEGVHWTAQVRLHSRFAKPGFVRSAFYHVEGVAQKVSDAMADAGRAVDRLIEDHAGPRTVGG